MPAMIVMFEWVQSKLPTWLRDPPAPVREDGTSGPVMRAIARRGLGRPYIGSTAERVLDKLPCDLVIIKPATFEVPRVYG